ncbi:homeobox-domain-containing protein [Conidiobolus coronatus NRRL 28638]|uniref:Homeobox-domain-containing protein n=1 Tax=Conidiobolus coronatus (strain ATCC 28846 / CBS 209.66 / NRRL 28638) TaxID=796925 RepID=A0A137NTQ0_CONC2|nr:homeobox-domain-containing protein [Conidiobolus coronatus NRRL 28638]|eukprot:KXN66078.1 homeobox-domain-containing protein [Conidiobolus coronatus NRRL 28638]
MSLNIYPRSINQYSSLAPLQRPSPQRLTSLPPIGAVFPEFFKQREAPTAPRKQAFQRSQAPKLQYNTPPSNSSPPLNSVASSSASNSRSNSVNYSMPFLYSMHGKLRARIQSKSYLPRRKRVTTMQLQVLNEEFRNNPFPSIEQRTKLSSILNISARSIQIWFQNKRQSVRSFNY